MSIEERLKKVEAAQAAISQRQSKIEQVQREQQEAIELLSQTINSMASDVNERVVNTLNHTMRTIDSRISKKIQELSAEVSA